MADKQPYIYTAADIRRYMSGGMTTAEMHELERAALQDPFLSDAIEGYRTARPQQTTNHLNEIKSFVQAKKPEAAVIQMPKKRKYVWGITAAAAMATGIGLFLFYKSSTNNTLALAKEQTSAKVADTSADAGVAQVYPKVDSLPAAPSETSPLANNMSKWSRRKNKSKTPVASKPHQPENASAASYQNFSLRQAATAQPKTADTAANEIAMARAATHGDKFGAPADKYFVWSKEKPLLLLQVEEISLGQKNKKPADTAIIKPEGGWQSFRDYLFSKLSGTDTAAFNDMAPLDDRLELEFSLSENGHPYDVEVIGATDSTTAAKTADAIKQGPNWINKDRRKKRLTLKL